MEWEIEVGYKPTATDAIGKSIERDIHDLGIEGVEYVKALQLYIIKGDVTGVEIESICKNLLTDNVTEYYSLHSKPDSDAWIVDVLYKPGVTDPVSDSVLKGIRDLGILGVSSVRTGKRYIIKGNLSEEDIERICKRLLANDVIQLYSYRRG